MGESARAERESRGESMCGTLVMAAELERISGRSSAGEEEVVVADAEEGEDGRLRERVRVCRSVVVREGAAGGGGGEGRSSSECL